MSTTMSWGWRVFMRVFMLVALGSVSLAALPANAQEMECDTDPLIFIDSGDGRMFILHQWFKTSLRLPTGEVVSVNDMKRHLETESTYRVRAVVRGTDAYTLYVESLMQPYPGRPHFTYSTWLTDDATGVKSEKVTAVTGQWVTQSIQIPVSRIERTERPKKNTINEAICDGVITGLQPDIKVPAGANCQIQGAIVNGDITVEPGGKLRVYKSKIDGDINARDAAYVQLNYPNGNPMTAVEVTGDVKIDRSRATTTEPNAICDRTIIGDDLKITNGKGEVFIGDFGKCKSGNILNRHVNVTGNQGAVHIADNNIDGDLRCERNAPALTSNGQPNRVEGKRSGQCVAIS